MYIILTLLSSLAFQLYRGRKKYCFTFGTCLISKEVVFSNPIKSVTLIGMCHVGRSKFYESLKNPHHNNFFGYDDPLVLNEGVRGTKKSKKNTGYANIAKALGLTQQPKKLILSRQCNADVSLSDLPKPTQDVIRIVFDIVEGIEILGCKKLGKLVSKMDANIDKHGPLQARLCDSRNRRLIQVLRNKLRSESRIIIPWGGSHLPEIEGWLLSRGFTAGRTRYRVVMNYVPVVIPAIRLIWRILKKP
jgi:hypothetical protein